MAISRATRAAAITIAAGMAAISFSSTAVAEPAGGASGINVANLTNPQNPLTDLVDAAKSIQGSTATISWKNSKISRNISIEGKPGTTHAQIGDILVYTVTYTDNNVIPYGIQTLIDAKPSGLEYVPASATYKKGQGDWENPNESDKWLKLTGDGAVNFASNFWQSWSGQTITFTWKYRVAKTAPGQYNTGMHVRFNTAGMYDLSQMGPKITIDEKPAGMGGSLGSFGSPSLNSPGIGSEGAKKFFEGLSALMPK